MAGQIGDLLLRPESFFAGRAGEPESLKVPAVIAITGAIISAAAAYLTLGITMELFGNVPEMAGMKPILVIVGVVIAFFTFLVLWGLIVPGVFYLISMAFSGTGAFKRTILFSLYGLVPIIIGSFLSLLVSLYYIPMIQVPTLTAIQDPAAIEAAMQQLMQDTAFRELRLISAVLSGIFLLWSANLWIFGLKHARSLTLKQAAITVLIPVAAYIVFLMYTAMSGIPGLGGI